MTEPLTASALRQEGPQQECALKHIATVAMTAQSDPHASAAEYRRSLIEICNFALAALSASRTAQAPQQEGVDLEPIKVRESVATRGPWTPYDNHILLPSVGAVEFVTDNPHAGDSSADTHFIAHARTDIPALIAEIERHRARIQVLETSVDYLRNLVDHPVTQGGMGVHRPVLNGNHRSILVDRDADVRREMRAYLDTLTIHGDNIGDIRRSLFMPFDSQWNGWVREDTAEREISVPDPPVAPAEGEQ